MQPEESQRRHIDSEEFNSWSSSSSIYKEKKENDDKNIKNVQQKYFSSNMKKLEHSQLSKNAQLTITVEELKDQELAQNECSKSNSPPDQVYLESLDTQYRKETYPKSNFSAVPLGQMMNPEESEKNADSRKNYERMKPEEED